MSGKKVHEYGAATMFIQKYINKYQSGVYFKSHVGWTETPIKMATVQCPTVCV